MNHFFRKYKFKVYLNASHRISINGKQGNIHPHTWEFGLEILILRREFMEFNTYEKGINQFFDQYQNTTLNDHKPFDVTIPTLENITEYFGEQLRGIIRQTGGELVVLEGSETPTRSYVIDYSQDFEYVENVEKQSKENVNNVLDKMLDEMIGGTGE